MDLHRANLEMPYLIEGWIAAQPDLDRGEFDELVRLAIPERDGVTDMRLRLTEAVDTLKDWGLLSPASATGDTAQVPR